MNTSLQMNRRRVLRQACLTAAGWAVARAAVPGANDDVRVAIIGLGNKGKQHAQVFRGLRGVRVAALCDVDPRRLAAVEADFKKAGQSPFTATDPRRVLERPEVDAVVIATPNHWHALLTLWAIAAGKDVYVEKPVSHNPHEGVLLTAAAKASGRIVQGGTQARSDRGLAEAIAWLAEGHVGKPVRAHVFWYEHRLPIGKCAPFTPDWLDYDLWCGPAPVVPLPRPELHYDWHWAWSTGDGDLGNSGIHALDGCRWFLGNIGHPRRVMSVGGRFQWDDAGETPNTQLVLLDYPDLPVSVEIRNLPMKAGGSAMANFQGIREGFALFYEGGCFTGLRGSGRVVDAGGKVIRKFSGDGGGAHPANFIAAVRSRRQADLAAPVEQGTLSSAVCHWGNISHRLGQPASPDECRRALGNMAHGVEMLAAAEEGLRAVGVDLEKTPARCGPWLELDAASGGIRAAGEGGKEVLDQALAMAAGHDREPYRLPAGTP